MRTRAPMLALAALAACATGEPQRQKGPPPFQDVKTVALVRWVEPGAPRHKDPLDALRESLDARGYRTQVVEIGPRLPAQRDAERVYRVADGRVASGAGRGGAHVQQAGKDAASAVAALGVDAVATYHSLLGQAVLPLDASPVAPPMMPGGPFDTTPQGRPYRPEGAIALVGRDGSLVFFDWGSPPSSDPSAPANAMEAIDAVLRVLAGQSPESAAYPDEG